MPPQAPRPDRGGAVDVLLVFARLGLTSFGGPVAHLGYFQAEFVDRRRWLSAAAYADLVALCQFLPGPASSQVGIAIGLARAGWAGALAAWLGFTLPSALLMISFALGSSRWPQWAASGVVHGLKVAAVAVVARALWGMSRSLCPDAPRAVIALACAAVVLAWPGAAVQMAVIAASALVGVVGLRAVDPAAAAGVDPKDDSGAKVGTRTGAALLSTFALLLVVLPALASAVGSPALSALAAFYEAGSLVFGGGHAVLPLLQSRVVGPGWIGNDAFVAGYGAAQALPGPLFSFAAYLGASMAPLGGAGGGLAALAALFVPGFLLVTGALPFWQRLRTDAGVRRAMAGANAAVVGVLAAALAGPVWAGAIRSGGDLALAAATLALLSWRRLPAIAAVAFAAAVGGWSHPG